MSEDLFSRATGPLLQALERRGIATSDLVQGTGISSQTLRRSDSRISWDQWVALLDRAEELGGPDVLERIGMEIHQVSWNRILAAADSNAEMSSSRTRERTMMFEKRLQQLRQMPKPVRSKLRQLKPKPKPRWPR